MSGAVDIPEPWAGRMIQRGFTDRRGGGDRPSISALAERCGTHTSTISKAIAGRGRPSQETLAALVTALGPDVADWVGMPRPKAWVPPASAALMSDRQRRAVEEIINSMTESMITPAPQAHQAAVPGDADVATWDADSYPHAARPGTPDQGDDNDWAGR